MSREMSPFRFLSTPSARRATGFYCTAVVLYAISIHALREEGDIRGGDTYSLGSDFYPRPPRGGRPSDMTIPTSKDSFLSTPSARRATDNIAVFFKTFCISIHALREEGDCGAVRGWLRATISIHALREEGDCAT